MERKEMNAFIFCKKITEKDIGRTASCKPRYVTLMSQAPFARVTSSSTQNKCHFGFVPDTNLKEKVNL